MPGLWFGTKIYLAYKIEVKTVKMKFVKCKIGPKSFLIVWGPKLMRQKNPKFTENKMFLDQKILRSNCFPDLSFVLEYKKNCLEISNNGTILFGNVFF